MCERLFQKFQREKYGFSGFCYVRVLFCNTYSRKEPIAPVGIIISRLESISRGSCRFSGGSRCELSHNFKRNPICTFISPNKGHFAVLWKKQLLTEISSLAQTTLETKYNRSLPTPQFLLKTFFTCSKNRKNSKKISMVHALPL